MAQERHEPQDVDQRWGEPPKARPRGRPVRRPDGDDLLIRLERLEAVVTAIAEHLGVRSGLAGRPGRRPGRRPAARRAPAGETLPGAAGEGHAVVRIVNRGLTGRIKLYNASRGYGFLVSSDAQGDVFFHRSDCRTDPSMLEPGTEVAFDLVQMANGQLKAVRIGQPQGRHTRDRSAPLAGDAGKGSSRPVSRQPVEERTAAAAV